MALQGQTGAYQVYYPLPRAIDSHLTYYSFLCFMCLYAIKSNKTVGHKNKSQHRYVIIVCMFFISAFFRPYVQFIRGQFWASESIKINVYQPCSMFCGVDERIVALEYMYTHSRDTKAVWFLLPVCNKLVFKYFTVLH